MPDFDPYSEWLQIPLGHRPVVASALLGLDPAEIDRLRISRAAADAYEKIRPYAASPDPETAAHGQRILGEISRALVAFLDRAAFLADSRCAAADLTAAAPWPEPEARPWQMPSHPSADLPRAVVRPEPSAPASRLAAYGVVAAISLGAGFLAGLAVAAMAQGRIGPVTAERDQLAVEVATLQGRSATVLAELDQRAAKNENTAKRLSGDLAAYKRTTEADFFAELDQQRRISEHFCLAHLKSQALLGLILAKPQCRSYFFSRGFDKSFEAAWYRPRQTFELFGTAWLWEEMKEQGLFEGSKLFNKADAELLARFGDADDGLARMKELAAVLCRDSPAK